MGGHFSACKWTLIPLFLPTSGHLHMYIPLPTSGHLFLFYSAELPYIAIVIPNAWNMYPLFTSDGIYLLLCLLPVIYFRLLLPVAWEGGGREGGGGEGGGGGVPGQRCS